MIKIENIKKSFNHQEVLKGINCQVPKGKLTTLMGRSGGGKSVLLKHLIGLLQPDEGKIFVQGEETTGRHGKKARRKFLENLGVVFQGGALFDSLTLFENVAYPLTQRLGLKEKNPDVRERVMKRLEEIGLSGMENKYPGELSGGMQKRGALARALVTKPQMLIFDEPTTGLDPFMERSVHQLIRETQQKNKLTVFVVSHAIPSVFDISDKIIFIHEGKIGAEGNVEEILKNDHPGLQALLDAARHNKTEKGETLH